MSQGSRRSMHALILLAAITAMAAALGGWVTDSSVKTWYPGLIKPARTPPSWVFGPVWTVLYAAMAVAAWRVWKKVGWGGEGRPLVLYFAQLGLNALWSVLFFGLRSPLLGSIEILILWVAILATLTSFRRVDRLAGFLFIPYLAWVTYASVLTVAIWRMN